MMNPNNVNQATTLPNPIWSRKDKILNVAKIFSNLFFVLSLCLVCIKELNFFIGLSVSFLPLVILPLVSYFREKPIKSQKEVKTQYYETSWINN